MTDEERAAVSKLRETLNDMIEWRNYLSGKRYDADMLASVSFIARFSDQIEILEGKHSTHQ